MNKFDYIKPQICDSVASRVMDRLEIRNETRTYSSHEIHQFLVRATDMALSEYNGIFQSEMTLLQVDQENRIKIQNLSLGEIFKYHCKLCGCVLSLENHKPGCPETPL